MGAPDLQRLAAAASRALNDAVGVDGLRRLSGGASRETWAFDATGASGELHALILRRDPGSHAGQSSRDVEFLVLRAAYDSGVTAPEPIALLDESDGLGAGFLMRRVEGETIARRILRNDEYVAARFGLAGAAGTQAARIHAVDPSSLPDLPVLGAREQIEQHRAILDSLGEPHPAFELGLRWLDQHEPPRAEPRLVHGDFRNGNFVVDADGLQSVLDWELAHLGDPVEDLGWLCVKSWRFGVTDHRVGGFGDVDDLLAAYQAAGGSPIDPEHLRYWEAFGTLKWGIICEMQAFAHLQGLVRSVELAVLGRRVCEMEWDLLELIE